MMSLTWIELVRKLVGRQVRQVAAGFWRGVVVAKSEKDLKSGLETVSVGFCMSGVRRALILVMLNSSALAEWAG